MRIIDVIARTVARIVPPAVKPDIGNAPPAPRTVGSPSSVAPLSGRARRPRSIVSTNGGDWHTNPRRIESITDLFQ